MFLLQLSRLCKNSSSPTNKPINAYFHGGHGCSIDVMMSTTCYLMDGGLMLSIKQLYWPKRKHYINSARNFFSLNYLIGGKMRLNTPHPIRPTAAHCVKLKVQLTELNTKLQNLFEKWKMKTYSFYFIPQLISLHIILIPRSIEGPKQFHISVMTGSGCA